MTLAELTHIVEHVDTDADGVMHFTRYQSLFESATLQGLEDRELGPRHWSATGHSWAMVEVHTRYRSPARYMDSITVSAEVETVGAGRMSVSVRAVDDAGLNLATGSLTLCLVNATGAPIPLPPSCKDLTKPAAHTGQTPAEARHHCTKCAQEVHHAQ